ncbi:hypothetical protein ABIF70_005119 [Bradyrhizobium japonicum]
MIASASPKSRIAELAKRLDNGESLDDVAASASSAPPVWHARALERAAFLGNFNDVRFRDLLVPEFPEADFATCIAMPGVERARALPEETYRLKHAVAAAHLQVWLDRQGSSAIRKFSGEALNKIVQTTDEVEHLRFLIPVDAEKALSLFDRLFDQADQSFDLARCNELMELLRELDNFTSGDRSVPLRLLSPGLRERLDTLARYVATRGRFIEEYSKSANFLPRDELVDPTRKFLYEPTGWLLTLYGRGGIGKTMFLRWLIAREAIPRPRCIPVARIDFDEIDISKLAKFPGLMFIHFAEQLNRQIPGAPFEEYLASYSPFAILLLPPARIPKGIDVGVLESEFLSDPALNDILTESFGAKLSKSVVVILDTLEEGVLHFPDALKASLGRLRSVHNQSRHLKVLLAGRYDLKARKYLLETDPEPVELKPLSKQDAKRLLCEIIGLEASPIVDATVRKSEGNPFILSLIAQLIQNGDVKTVGDVDALKPEFAYLIKRVIERIPDSQRAVRWVVRYGVVPRSLTHEFIDAVMRPYLERELAEAAGAHRDRLQQFEDSFPRASTFDLKAEWRNLKQYADECGWLRADEEHLRFQPEVVRPMRTLLRDESVFTELHASAAEWFSGRAVSATTDDQWARAMADAIYHRFAGGAPDAESLWRATLALPRAQNVERRRILLEAVTELLDLDAFDRGAGTSLPVESRVAADAIRELAKVRAGIGFGPVPAPDNPSQIVELLRLESKILGGSMAADDRLIRLALAVASRDNNAALKLGSELDSATLASPAEQYTLRILQARTSIAAESANRFYTLACAILEANDNPYPAAAVWTECAHVLGNASDWVGAMAAYANALVRTTNLGDVVLLRGDIAELMIDGCEYDAAQTSISAGNLEDLRDQAVRARERFRRGRITALCEIARGQPDRAEPIVAELVADSPLQEAQLLELQGDLAAVQYNPRAASRLLDRARQRYADARQEKQANMAQLKRLRVVKDQIGDWRMARELLTRFIVQARSFSKLAPLVAIEAAQLAALTGEQTLPFLDHPFAQAAMNSNPEECVRLFLDQLQAIQPPAARYQFLKVFAGKETQRKPPVLAREVMAVVPPPSVGDADFLPRAFGSIELLRVLGWKESHEQLQSALALDRPAVLHRLLEAADRLQEDVPAGEMLARCQARSQANGFGFAAAVRYARLALERGKPDLAGKAVDLRVPEELRGTQIEALHNLNNWLDPKLSDRAKRLARHRAAEILRQLGQDKNVADLVGPPHGSEAAPGGLWSRKSRATVVLNEVSVPWSLTSKRELVPYELAKLLAGPPDDNISQLKRALAEWELTSKVGVELSIDGDEATAMLPWEWALGDHDVCFRSSTRVRQVPRRFYQTLGAKLPPRLRQFFAFFRPLRVIILRPPIVSQESIGRGFELQSRRRLTDIYAAHGVRAIEPAGLEVEQIKSAMVEHNPDVVHIQAAVQDLRRDLLLDLPFRSALPSPEYLVEQFSGDTLPLIILDPPRPLEDVETARQLLLRNRFAGALIATGKVRAVLAAGLLQPQDLQFAMERLANRLGGLPILRELLDLFRRDLNADRFSSDGAALFAADPDDAMP